MEEGIVKEIFEDVNMWIMFVYEGKVVERWVGLVGKGLILCFVSGFLVFVVCIKI